MEVTVSHLLSHLYTSRYFACLGPCLWNRHPLQFAPTSSLAVLPHLSLNSNTAFLSLALVSASEKDHPEKRTL